MKWVLRASSFSICFFLGLLLANLISFGWGGTVLEHASEAFTEMSELERSAKSPTGIRVMYAGWEPGTPPSVSSLKFVIYNGSSLPIRYSAHNPENPWAQLRINGEKQEPIYGCGTGIQTFYILPGSSAEVLVTVWDFSARPEAGDSITAGFYLRSLLSEERKAYTSEPFILAEEFRLAIKNR